MAYDDFFDLHHSRSRQDGPGTARLGLPQLHRRRGQSRSQREPAIAGNSKRHAGSPNHTPSTKQITTDRCGVRWM
jgi:hypothetical protein